MDMVSHCAVLGQGSHTRERAVDKVHVQENVQWTRFTYNRTQRYAWTNALIKCLAASQKG